jgi:hypothetical protein
MWDASTWWGSDFNFLDRKFQSLMQELSNPAASSLLSGEISSAQQLLCVVEGIEADGSEGGGPVLDTLDTLLQDLQGCLLLQNRVGHLWGLQVTTLTAGGASAGIQLVVHPLGRLHIQVNVHSEDLAQGSVVAALEVADQVVVAVFLETDHILVVKECVKA